MNPLLSEYIVNLSNFIGAYLDKLKITNPFLFMTLSSALLVANSLFIFDIVSINNEVDSLVIFFLSTITTFMFPRTSKAKESYKNKTKPQVKDVEEIKS
jgi:hypothetical protein